jgi:hypothetical protein
MKKQSAGELSRTIAGQWSKSEKRAHIARSIAGANQRTRAILKAIRQQQHMQ